MSFGRWLITITHRPSAIRELQVSADIEVKHFCVGWIKVTTFTLAAVVRAHATLLNSEVIPVCFWLHTPCQSRHVSCLLVSLTPSDSGAISRTLRRCCSKDRNID